MIRRHQGEFRWAGVDVHPYKEDGSIFRSVTRQTLFGGGHDLPVELRYFEVGPGGHSTLERHEHAHLVMIIRGSGHVLVGEDVCPVACQDLVQVPPMTWHQFRATGDEPLGFLCIVSATRDRPQRPQSEEIAELIADPEVADFIRV
jgi:mannose-6-phosphate isomerase-like protein (cupin superfamily)